MKTLKTNLGLLIEEITVDTPIKSSTPIDVKIVDLTDNERLVKVTETWDNLRVAIFDLYKDKKGTATMDDVKKEFKKEIKFLNENIKISDINYSLENKCIKAKIGNLRVGQLSTQNRKLLPNNLGQGFVIWNILGHISCNGKTKCCSSCCYNNCKSFGTHLRLKIDNLILSLLDIFGDVIKNLIELSPHVKTIVRIHEDGDFYDMTYYKKWEKISTENKNYQFEAYTKEPKLMEKINEINKTFDNLLLRFSIMEDTNQDIIKYVKENNLLTYVAIGTHKKDKNAKEVFEMIPQKNRCIGNCQFCKKCYSKESVMIFTTIH